MVLKAGAQASAEELRQYLAHHFVKWWLPDAFEFVDEIPRTSTGKFLKTALRERFRRSPTATAVPPASPTPERGPHNQA